jgi:hypothetical protein
MNRMRKTAEPISRSRTWFEHFVSRSRGSWDGYRSWCRFGEWSDSKSWSNSRFWRNR